MALPGHPGVPGRLLAGHKVKACRSSPDRHHRPQRSTRTTVLIEVQRVIGANVMPSGVLRQPTDRRRRTGHFREPGSPLLLEILLGYRGIDTTDRGEDPEADAVLTVAQIEHLIATWIVNSENREASASTPAWDPGTRHSPNTLFAAAMSQGGFALQIPAPQLYYELLQVHQVKIHGRRGVKIRGLWYDGPALDPYRSGPSAQGGAAKGKWKIRRDPRDRRFTFFCDPLTGDWHTLRWTGLPPEGEVPSFSDVRADDLLRAARAGAVQPRSDASCFRCCWT